MDGAYLKKTVGGPLCEGLAAVALENPEDPVDFLGHWLLKYLARQKVNEAVISAEKEAIRSAEIALVQEQTIAAAKIKAKEEKDSKVDAILNAQKQRNMWANTINVIKENTPAVNVYTSLFEKRVYAEGEEQPPEEEEEAPPEEEAEQPPEEEDEEETPELDENGDPIIDEDGNPVMRKVEKVKIEKEKPLPRIPKSNILRYNSANEKNSFLVNRTLNRKQGPTTFEAIDNRSGILVTNIFDWEKPIYFHDMPIPGSYMCHAFLDVEKGIVGCVHADTMGGEERFKREDEEFFAKAVSALTLSYDRLVTQVAIRRSKEIQIILDVWGEMQPSEEETISEENTVENIDEKIQLTIGGRYAKIMELINEHLTSTEFHRLLNPDEDEPPTEAGIGILAAVSSILNSTKSEPLKFENLKNFSDVVKAVGDPSVFVTKLKEIDLVTTRIRKAYETARMTLRLIPPPPSDAPKKEKTEGEEGEEEGEAGEPIVVTPITIEEAAHSGFLSGFLFIWVRLAIEISDKHTLARQKEAEAEERGEGELPRMVEIDSEEETRRENDRLEKERLAREAVEAAEREEREAREREEQEAREREEQENAEKGDADADAAPEE